MNYFSATIPVCYCITAPRVFTVDTPEGDQSRRSVSWCWLSHHFGLLEWCDMISLLRGLERLWKAGNKQADQSGIYQQVIQLCDFVFL